MTDNITYEEVLKPAKKMTMKMAEEYSYAANLSDEKQKEAIKEILLQPYMKDTYESNKLEARDVAEFVEQMANSSFGPRTSIISNFARNVLTTDRDGNRDGAICIREAYVLKGKLKSQLYGKIKSFVEKKNTERNQLKESPKWYKDPVGWLKQKKHSFARATNVFVITAGISLPIAAISISKMNDYSPDSAEKAKQRVTAKIMKPAENNVEKETKSNKTSMAILDLIKKSKETVKE